MVGVTTLVVLLNAWRWILKGAYVLAFLLMLWWVLQVPCDWMDRKRFSIAASCSLHCLRSPWRFSHRSYCPRLRFSWSETELLRSSHTPIYDRPIGL
jgi:hypothetical protein